MHHMEHVRSCLRSGQSRACFLSLLRTSVRQNHLFSVVDPSVWNRHPLALVVLPNVQSVHSDMFYSNLTAILLVMLALGAFWSSSQEGQCRPSCIRRPQLPALH